MSLAVAYVNGNELTWTADRPAEARFSVSATLYSGPVDVLLPASAAPSNGPVVASFMASPERPLLFEARHASSSRLTQVSGCVFVLHDADPYGGRLATPRVFADMASAKRACEAARGHGAWEADGDGVRFRQGTAAGTTVTIHPVAVER